MGELGPSILADDVLELLKKGGTFKDYRDQKISTWEARVTEDALSLELMSELAFLQGLHLNDVSKQTRRRQRIKNSSGPPVAATTEGNNIRHLKASIPPQILVSDIENEGSAALQSIKDSYQETLGDKSITLLSKPGNGQTWDQDAEAYVRSRLAEHFQTGSGNPADVDLFTLLWRLDGTNDADDARKLKYMAHVTSEVNINLVPLTTGRRIALTSSPTRLRRRTGTRCRLTMSLRKRTPASSSSTVSGRRANRVETFIDCEEASMCV